MNATAEQIAPAGGIEAAEWFLRELYRGVDAGWVTICWPQEGWTGDAKAPLKTRWFRLDQLAEAARFAVTQSGRTCVWFGVGVRGERSAIGRGASDDVIAITAVWADADYRHGCHDKTNLPPDEAAALDLLRSVGVPPSVVLRTGHGLHGYWLLAEPLLLTDAAARTLAKGLLDALKAKLKANAVAHEWAIDSVQDFARVMRVPGTMNRKDAFGVRPVEVVDIDHDARYSVEDLLTAFAPPAAERPPASGQYDPPPDFGEPTRRDAAADLSDEDLLDKARAAKNGHAFSRLWNGVTADHGNDASAADQALCNHLAWWATGDRSRVDRLFRRSGLYRPKWDEKHSAEGLTYGEMTIDKAVDGLNGKGYTGPGTNGQASPNVDTMSKYGTEAPEEWRDPVPLQEPPPPPLTSDMLPGWFAEMVDAVSAATEAPVELPTAVGMAMVSTGAQGRFEVKVSAGYREPTNTYNACGYPAGGRKTAVVNTMAGPAWAWEDARRKEFEAIVTKWEADDAALKARIAGTLAKIKATEEGTKLADLQAEVQALTAQVTPKPYAPRLTAEDATTEHAGTMLGLHNQRLTFVSDEGGVLDFGSRYSASGADANIDLFLKAHSGSRAQVDRGSRPSIILPNPLISMGLLPQPSVIAKMAMNAAYRNRGMLARFNIWLPPSRLGFRTLNGPPVPEDVRETYRRRLTELFDMAPSDDGEPYALELAGDAWRIWKDFAQEVEQMMRPNGLLEHATDYGGKLPGAAARTAGLFYIIEHGTEAVTRRTIDRHTMYMAVEFSRLAARHYVYAVAQADPKGDVETAKRIWRRVADGTTPLTNDVATARDLWLPVRGTYRKVAEIEGGFRTLIDHAFMREVPSAETDKPGRPSRKFRLNPKALAMGVSAVFAHMRTEEQN